MTTITKDADQIIKKWWIFILLGVLLIIGGISVMMTPVKTYLTLSVFFSLAVLVSGFLKILFSFSIRKTFKNWGYYFTNGSIEFLVAIVLLIQPIITMILLPLILGIWLLFGAIFTIGAAYEIKSFHLKSWIWVLVIGILLAISSLFILSDPVLSIMSIVHLCSGGIIIYGISHVIFGFKLKKIKENMA